VAQRAKNKPELKIVVSNTPEVPAVEPAPEQVEMPFAIVNGEPVTQMPKDLYIPPQAMEVFLEAFEGPLDLLLYLIRRQNLNILDIPLAEITRQYMQYIEVMTELQLELAGEYMVMAATLAEIKSRMLLPRPKVDPEGNEADPRAELVRRLQEYERFKRAAEGIDTLQRLERDVWQTSAELKDRKVVRLLPTVTLQEMLIAFKDVVVRSEMFAHHHIQRERLSVRERMTNVITMLENASFVEFVRLFQVEEGRMGVTVTFMAILELVREGLIEIVQAEPFAPIHVRAAGASRKLHVVGGSEALAGEAVVVGEAVVGDAPAIGVLAAPADLESITELVLDPDFVDDDDDDDEEEGFLEGVDDVLDGPLPPPVAEVALADAGSTPPAVEPTSVVDEWTAGIEPFALVGAAADVVAEPAPLVADVTAVEPPSIVDLASAVADEPVLATDIVGAAVESVLVAEPVDVAFSPAVDVVPSVAANVEPATDVVAASVESVLADVPVPVEAGALVELAPIHDPATADLPEPVVDLAATQVDVPASAHELASAPAANDLSAVDVPSPLIDEPSESAGSVGDEIAVTLEPSLTDVTVAVGETSLCGADVAPAAEPGPAIDEPVVTVDPAVFDAPAVTAESEPPSGTPPEEEPPTFDVEYEVSAEDLAAAEQAASDDDVSLVGDTSVAGDVSLVGEESVSGGPAVEVEEFAFDELPALDEAEHADQQPAAGAQTEESDD
jgi:chromatin segregation and condensation protein Rec8/ScpA/Scc1 (kleisin family)